MIKCSMPNTRTNDRRVQQRIKNYLFTFVLVLAGIELIFFLVAGTVLFWVQYEKNVDNTLIFSVVPNNV